MKQQQKADPCRQLAEKMSRYIYSVEPPPEHLNRLFLDWIDRGITPTAKALAAAEKADSESVKP